MDIKKILEDHTAWLQDSNTGARANLRDADLSYADLSRADLSSADLSNADLSNADLSDADLSGADGLLTQSVWIRENLEEENDGYIVYKTFMEYREPSVLWEIKENSVITENVNYNRAQECGCGVNVGTAKYVKTHCKKEAWECLIEWKDLSGICIPYNTDGKFRAEKVKLIRKITRSELLERSV